MTIRMLGGRSPGIAALVLAGLALAGVAGSAPGPAGTEVKVERVRPAKEKLATLRFFKENRDWIRAQFDRLRERPVGLEGQGAALDPRTLTYQSLLAEALASQDTVTAAEDERARRHLLASITQLGSLETELDRMERLLGDQRVRLAVLEDDFTGHQQTELMVVLSGYPSESTIDTVAIAIDDGATLRVPLSAEQRESLRKGGMVELFHGLAEPHEQVVQVTLTGAPWPAGDAGYLTLDPMRDRLTFLRLDLSDVQPARGGASIRASTWLHEAKPHGVDG